jgi:hypothetical protein
LLQFRGSGAAGEITIPDARAAVFRKAGDDLLLLIAHLSRQGKIDKEHLAPALKIAKKAATSTLTDEEEGEFWHSYAALAQSARPASIDALHIEKYAGSLGWPPDRGGGQRWVRRLPFAARSAINQHLRTLAIIRILAVIVFAVTLVLVAYLTFTEGILKKNDELTREYALLSGGSVTGTQIEQIILAYRDAERSARERAAPTPADDQTQPSARNINGNASAASGQPAAARGRNIDGAATADSGQSAAPTEEAASEQTILGTPSNDTLEGYLIQSRQAEIETSVKYNDDLLRTFLPSSLTEGMREVPRSTAFPILPLETPIRTLQGSINEMLSRYVLPMLAAALGVFVFILRTSSAQFRDLSFVASDVSNYWPRIILGIVAGLVIGWFLGQEPTGVLATISPAAIAFITGYSVEIFFNLLDSIIKALGAGSKESARS